MQSSLQQGVKMAEINISSNKGVTLVDDPYFEELNQDKWFLNNNGYVRRVGKIQDGDLNRKSIMLHRQIMGVLRKSHFKIQVDHINHNKLDNRCSNLRICSITQNQRNANLHKDSFSGYKGVRYRRGYKSRPWEARIRVNKRLLSLGAFSTKEEAAKSYNEAAVKYFGEFAHTNEVKVA
jgi:hypothetical protein